MLLQTLFGPAGLNFMKMQAHMNAAGQKLKLTYGTKGSAAPPHPDLLLERSDSQLWVDSGCRAVLESKRRMVHWSVEERRLEDSSHSMIHPSPIVQNACLTGGILLLAQTMALTRIGTFTAPFQTGWRGDSTEDEALFGPSSKKTDWEGRLLPVATLAMTGLFQCMFEKEGKGGR